MYFFQLRYYRLGDRILVYDMPGFEVDDQKSVRLEHVVEILEGRIANKSNVTT